MNALSRFLAVQIVQFFERQKVKILKIVQKIERLERLKIRLND